MSNVRCAVRSPLGPDCVLGADRLDLQVLPGRAFYAAPFVPVADYNIIADPAEFAGALPKELIRG